MRQQHKTPVDPVLLAGPGPKILAEVSQLTGMDGAQVLRNIADIIFAVVGANEP